MRLYLLINGIIFLLRNRYLRHEASIQLSASLRFSASCCRVQGAEVLSLILTIRCKNLSPQVSVLIHKLTALIL